MVYKPSANVQKELVLVSNDYLQIFNCTGCSIDSLFESNDFYLFIFKYTS